MRSLVGLGRQPLQGALFASRDLARRLPALSAAADLVILQLARLAPYVHRVGKTPLVVDLIDSLSLNLSARARFDRPWLRPLWRLEAHLLASAERRMVHASRRAYVVAGRDREHLAASFAQRGQAALAERVGVLPLAFSPAQSEGAGGGGEGEGEGAGESAGRPRLVLTGNLGYFPTTDGALWWLAEVWPRLREKRPELEVLFAGARPPRRLLRAARRRGARVVASPAELAPLLCGATLAIAPMRAGSGQPLKILEAWAQGVPVVASPGAAAGTLGEPGRDLVVAERPEEWVVKILHLLDHPEARARLVRNSRERLRVDYAPSRLRQRLLSELAGLGS